jgi:hypothetical protein
MQLGELGGYHEVVIFYKIHYLVIGMKYGNASVKSHGPSRET